MARGWEVEFYRRHWGATGLQPGDIRGLEDLAKIPPYTVYDLRDSIARSPPLGDYLGIDFDHDDPMPLILQTSGGTTGLPRAMLYSPRDREAMNILNGRRFGYGRDAAVRPGAGDALARPWQWRVFSDARAYGSTAALFRS